jgi:predicted  nucleic acid-binding Zn-ribbon protein
VEGDFRGTGRIAVRLMGAGIEQAKADYKVMLANMQQEKAENVRLTKQVSEQQERIAQLEEKLMIVTENSQRKNLEILGLTIGLNRQKRTTLQHEDQMQKLQGQIAGLEEQLLKLKISSKRRWN